MLSDQRIVVAGEPARPAELRERLLAAGERVFASSGFANTTVDDVIGAAATSRATFYRYFKSKEDLFDQLSVACFHDMRAVVKDLAQADQAAAGRVQLERLVAAYRDLHRRHGGVIRAWVERSDRPDSPTRTEAATAFAALLRGLERPIESAGAPSDVAPEVQAALLFILMERSSFYVFHRLSQLDPDRLAPTLATMIHRAYFGAPVSGHHSRLRIAAEASNEPD